LAYTFLYTRVRGKEEKNAKGVERGEGGVHNRILLAKAEKKKGNSGKGERREESIG